MQTMGKIETHPAAKILAKMIRESGSDEIADPQIEFGTLHFTHDGKRFSIQIWDATKLEELRSFN